MRAGEAALCAKQLPRAAHSHVPWGALHRQAKQAPPLAHFEVRRAHLGLHCPWPRWAGPCPSALPPSRLAPSWGCAGRWSQSSTAARQHARGARGISHLTEQVHALVCMVAVTARSNLKHRSSRRGARWQAHSRGSTCMCAGACRDGCSGKYHSSRVARGRRGAAPTAARRNRPAAGAAGTAAKMNRQAGGMCTHARKQTCNAFSASTQLTP